MGKVKPSATALVSWNVKFVVKLLMFTGVVKKTLPASISPPFVSSSWLLARAAEPLNSKPVELVKPVAKLILGAGAVEEKVQVLMFWMAVSPPVPPVKPTYAVFPPIVCGILIGHLVVNVLFKVLSVIVIARVVPL